MSIVDDVNIDDEACRDTQQRKLAIDLDGRIHCVYRKVPSGGSNLHIFYGYSDDEGVTWTTEKVTSGVGYIQYSPSMVVDSSGNSHVVFRVSGPLIGSIWYTKREAGSWAAPIPIPLAFLLTDDSGTFQIGETVRGDTSGATAILLNTKYIGYRLLMVDEPDAGFIIDETIRGLTSDATGTYYEDRNGYMSWPALAIAADDILHMTADENTSKRTYHFQKSPGGVWSHGDHTGLAIGATTTAKADIAVDLDGLVHIVVRSTWQYKHVCGTFYDWGAVHTIYDAEGDWPYLWQDFSLAVDLSGNAHVVIAQSGEGTYPAWINIYYFRRSALGVWSALELVTDAERQSHNPSIAVDKNETIRVIFLSKGYGSTPTSLDVVMRTKPSGGSWGNIESLTDRGPTQYDPGMMHSLFPASGSRHPNCPDGYAFIFNGRRPSDYAYTVEYGSEILEAVKAFPQMCLI